MQSHESCRQLSTLVLNTSTKHVDSVQFCRENFALTTTVDIQLDANFSLIVHVDKGKTELFFEGHLRYFVMK